MCPNCRQPIQDELDDQDDYKCPECGFPLGGEPGPIKVRIDGEDDEDDDEEFMGGIFNG